MDERKNETIPIICYDFKPWETSCIYVCHVYRDTSRYFMLVQMRTFYIYVCHDSMLIFDKNHGVSNVQTGPITRSNGKKIQQTFILHLQN